jgi:6-phosphogluconolactonase
MNDFSPHFLKLLPQAALLMSLASTALATPFYIGTSTTPGESRGIYVCELDEATGALGAVHLAAEANNPSFVAISPDRRFVYAVAETAAGAVTAFRRNKDNTLELLNSQPTGGAGPCHVCVAPDGRHVFVANYTGGSAACLPVTPDGALEPASEVVTFTGSGPNTRRQEKPHGHGIYNSPDGQFVYVCDLGTDKVWSFTLKAAKLVPTSPDAGQTPPGAGPRHLALHPNGRFAYVANELDCTTTVFGISSGVLTPVETVTAAAGELAPGSTASEIVCHPSGKFLYVSLRTQNAIAAYRIGDDGRLTLLENVPCGVKIPRGMDVDPSGRWLVVAGQDDNRLVVLAIDSESGRLTATPHTAEAPRPVCIAFPGH